MVLRYKGRSMGQSAHAPTSSLATDFSPSSVVVVSVLPLGRFLASMFSILSCFYDFHFNSAYDASFRNSFSIPNCFLPLGLFPIIRPSITSFNRLSPLSKVKKTNFLSLNSPYFCDKKNKKILLASGELRPSDPLTIICWRRYGDMLEM